MQRKLMAYGMTPDAYLYICIAYMSVAGLTASTLCLKGCLSHKKYRYMCKEDRQSNWKPLQYVLHTLHIPPYLIAAYWYYDAYQINKSEDANI